MRSTATLQPTLRCALRKRRAQIRATLAQAIVAALPASPLVARTEVAGAGFINFFLSKQAYADEIARIHSEAERYGRSALGRGERVLVEFVSANPTGPLHVGHGRQAAYGATLAALLDAVGFAVSSASTTSTMPGGRWTFSRSACGCAISS